MIEMLNLEDWILKEENFALCSLPAQANVVREDVFFKKKDNEQWINNQGLEFKIQPFNSYNKSAIQVETTKEQHLQTVSKAIQQIKSGVLQKVIVSRVKHAAIDANVQLHEIYERLKIKYPAAFVYLLKDSIHGIWMGATPEVLLTGGRGNYETMSLAGTLPNDGTLNKQWSPKLLQEQKIVTDFIQQKLESLPVEQLRVEGPITFPAGPIVHLKSSFQFSTHSSNSEILNALHPTPAICGLPRDAAKQWILDTELHERRLYTGYLGFEAQSGDVNYFVNLRCMQIFDDHAELYLGGGITADSDPLAEWNETEEKAKVLFSVLH